MWFSKKDLTDEIKQEYVLKADSEQYKAWAKKEACENELLREDISLLNLRIKKLEAVNLPVIVHCTCKRGK